VWPTSSLDANVLKSLMCWSYRDSQAMYNGFKYDVRGLLVEPYVVQLVL